MVGDSLVDTSGRRSHPRRPRSIGVQVYFCDPRSPWLRGSNENTNGLLRQYFPRGTDLAVHSQRYLDRVVHKLNDRPRKPLEWMKPSEKLAELLRRPDERASAKVTTPLWLDSSPRVAFEDSDKNDLDALRSCYVPSTRKGQIVVCSGGLSLLGDIFNNVAADSSRFSVEIEHCLVPL